MQYCSLAIYILLSALDGTGRPLFCLHVRSPGLAIIRIGRKHEGKATRDVDQFPYRAAPRRRGLIGIGIITAFLALAFLLL